MPISLDMIENLAGREPEALFARDEDGTLIRRVAATREMFAARVTVVIDGVPVEVPAAVPVTDPLGNPRNGPDGLPIPRATTIYDAAVQLVRDGAWRPDDLNERIPVLCHQQHLTPVAVCRVCSVHVSKRRKRDGRLAPSEKLVPACQHEVQPDMVVTTREGGYPGWDAAYRRHLARQGGTTEAVDASIAVMRESLARYAEPVRRAVGVLTECLLADHYHPDPPGGRDDRFRNELEDLARTTGHLARRTPSVEFDWASAAADAVPADAPASLSKQLIDLTDYDAADMYSGEFARRLDLPPGRAGDRGRNFAGAHPKSRPVPLPVVPPPAAAEGERDDPAWAAQDRADYERFPYSSRTVLVDHDRCVVCDRCVRACSEVRPFAVIGHTGKGYGTRVSFDLDRLMNDSTCVQCGECMVSCPTGALTLKRRVAPRAFADAPPVPKNPADPLPAAAGSRLLSATEAGRVEVAYTDAAGRTRTFRPFRSIPLAYLRWNEGAVRERRVDPGEVLCRQGEYGRTAFFLKDGRFDILFDPAAGDPERPGLLARLFGRGDRSPSLGAVIGTVDATATIVGELACLTARPRAASVRAATAGTVYEVTRNLLDVVQRSPAARDVLGLVYLRNAVRSCLRKNALFDGLTEDVRRGVADYLAGRDGTRERAALRRIEAGQAVVSAGDPAGDFYVIRFGTVKVWQAAGGAEAVLATLADDAYFGHVALLAAEAGVREALAAVGTAAEKAGRRTATVTALDRCEVVRVTGDAFHGMCAAFPDLKRRLVSDAARLLDARRRPAPASAPRLGEYLRQGLYQGQRMLALDLDRCTRCDECAKACAHAHPDGTSRLLRDGLRFGQFLVAASCRSCHTPYCMDGCPVDAVHRSERGLEVLIEDHCIGCSLCATNCPFGSIQMVHTGDAEGARRTAATAQKAVNCDLCHGLVPAGADPFCVSACPHEAAFRWDGPTLEAHAR